MRLPFLPLVNLLSEVDREKGKFLELMGTNEGEKLSRMSFLPSLGQRWAHTTTSKSRVCLKPGPFVLARPATKMQVHPCVRQCPAMLSSNTKRGPGQQKALGFPVSGDFILMLQCARL